MMVPTELSCSQLGKARYRAVFVAPPCWVTLGLQRILTAPFEKVLSVDLLLQT